MENYESTNPAEMNPTEASPETTAPEVCANCGAPLAEGQEFCPKCGTPRKKKTVCGKCGAELAEGQEFCPKCGQKVGLVVDANVTSAINQFNAGVDKQAQKKKKTPVIIAVVVVIIALLAVAGAKLAPKIFVSVEDLCAQGNYEKAYEKASGTEKNEVLAENNIAYLSQETSDSLKDPSSFVLREAYYEVFLNDEGEVGQEAVLYVTGNNSYGAAVSNYWLYVYDQDEGKWEYWASESSLSYDDDDDYTDKLACILMKGVVTGDNTIELSKTQIKNINNMFETDTLYTVDPIDVDNVDTSVIPVDEDAGEATE